MAESSIVLITGGNTGLGYESVKALYASSQAHTILMGSRSLAKATDAIAKLQAEVPGSKSAIVPIQIDIEDDKSIEKAFQKVKSKYGRIDTLVNNAGSTFDSIMLTDPSPSGIRATFNKAYSLNVTSSQVMTHIFAPLLIASSDPRLLFVTSGISSLERNSSDENSNFVRGPPPKGWPKPPVPSQIGYRTSKVALNMIMLEWKKTFKVDGVKVFGISPGFLATNLGGMGPEFLKNMGAADPSIGGHFIRDVVEGKRDEGHGKVINKDGVMPW
ncbi:NAD(P)-binding protein [Decorospora gaudefroyi]|uniref:NAD(P)-binding protein n=1 Tax=Decorospora gaudefroyi TaxID=184978 RepID=A0A6A5K7Y0_9PLEO|nr:NAD(P)-binding protein [Decorospora gaudefroyi]